MTRIHQNLCLFAKVWGAFPPSRMLKVADQMIEFKKDFFL